MKVFVRPTGLHSCAMVRVADALEQYAPPQVLITQDRTRADLVVSHVIGPDPDPTQKEIVIQYCLLSAGRTFQEWVKRWQKARLTWSYFNLPEIVNTNGFPFYHAPLGVDEAFTRAYTEGPRDLGILTSGYVSAPIGEAIEEAATAAWLQGLQVVHLGPSRVEGMTKTLPFSIHGVLDVELAEYYRRCRWVSGLRHVEGFELPVLEGLCCGARPIVFDREDMRQWYDEHAVFVPECSGQALVETLYAVMASRPAPVTSVERDEVLRRFNWQTIAEGFWERVLHA